MFRSMLELWRAPDPGNWGTQAADYKLSVWKQTTGGGTAPNQLRSFTSYLETLDAATRDGIQRLIGAAPVLQIEAPWTVGVQWWQAGSRTIVHFVNYDYNEPSDEVDDVRDIQVHVRRSARTAQWLSPDDGTGQRGRVGAGRGIRVQYDSQ